MEILSFCMDCPIFVFMKSQIQPLIVPEGYRSSTIMAAGDYAMNLRVSMDLIPYRAGQPYLAPKMRATYVLQGTAQFLVNLVQVELRTGALMIVPPGCVIELLERSPDMEVRLMAFGDEALDHLVLVSPQGEEKEDMEALMTAIWRGLRDKATDYVQTLSKAFVSKALMIEGAAPKKKSLRSEELFTQFIEAVNAWCMQNRRIPFYADKLGISAHHLSAIVKAVSGESAMSWIHRATIQRAKLLLSQGQTALQVSEALEFPDAPYFNRYFKRHTGMPPGAYQKQ